MAIMQTLRPADGDTLRQDPLGSRNVTELPQTTFRTALRGFDRDEVRTALEDVAADYRTLQMQNASLRRQLADLEGALASVRRVGPADTAPSTGGSEGDHVLQRAHDEAQVIVMRARTQAEEILARARTQTPAVEHVVEQAERERRQFRTILSATISDLLTALNMARRDGNGDEVRPADRAEVGLDDALVPRAAVSTEPAPRPSPNVEPAPRARDADLVRRAPRNAGNGSDADAVEHLEAVLRGIDSAMREIPALPRE